MEITHMTYALVKPGVNVPAPTLQPVHNVLGFLSDHIRSALSATRRIEAPPAGYFFNPDRQGLFRELHSGETANFLASFQSIARGLVSVMNNSTSVGLLVGLRASTDTDGIVAGVLKLEITIPNGAALFFNDDGSQVRLEAVQDLLDRPGDLQKSALVTSRLPEERVFCGDQLHTQAKYFPEALGIKIHPRPKAAIKEFLDIVWQLDEQLTVPVTAVLPTCSPGSVSQVLTEIGVKVPELTITRQQEIREHLASLAKPVHELDPARVLTGAYKVGDILVTGPMSAFDQIHITQNFSGRWRLAIESDTKPALTVSSSSRSRGHRG